MQPARPQIPQEETCPVPEKLLGELYRTSSHGLDSLIATVPAKTRAMLALYCHRRAHLQSIGLAVAASCEAHHLEEVGGHAGRVLFEKARAAPEPVQTTHYVGRKQVSLSRGTIMQVVIDQDLV
jgi:NADH dehydrogenase/NADH:ubiquinone oxidoreductase subunit G